MASRLLAGGRSRTLAQAINQAVGGSVLLSPRIAGFSSAAAADPRSKPFSVPDSRPKIYGHDQPARLSTLKPFNATSQVIPRWFSSNPAINSQTDKVDVPKESKKVMAFSPLEVTLPRRSALEGESLKVKRYERSINLTYFLIPALLLVSKWNITTALAVLSIYYQVYGFFKEIILDYVHHEVTQKWVFIYLGILLAFLAKETLLILDLV